MIRAKIPFIRDEQIETAERHQWFYKLNREFLDLVDHFVQSSKKLICVICKRNHNSESGLRNCISIHRWDSINYFIDHELIRVSF